MRMQWSYTAQEHVQKGGKQQNPAPWSWLVRPAQFYFKRRNRAGGSPRVPWGYFQGVP